MSEDQIISRNLIANFIKSLDISEDAIVRLDEIISILYLDCSRNKHLSIIELFKSKDYKIIIVLRIEHNNYQ